jgi:hypothetical protein
MPDAARTVTRSASELIPEAVPTPGSDIVLAFSTLHRRFARARLAQSCLPGSGPAFLQRSPPLPSAIAVCSGLRPAPDCRPRRALLHLSYSCAPPDAQDGARDTQHSCSVPFPASGRFTPITDGKSWGIPDPNPPMCPPTTCVAASTFRALIARASCSGKMVCAMADGGSRLFNRGEGGAVGRPVRQRAIAIRGEVWGC